MDPEGSMRNGPGSFDCKGIRSPDWPRVARQITGTHCIIKTFLSRSLGEAFMLQKLSKDICECYQRAEQCRRAAETAHSPSAQDDFLNMEQRWLSLAHSYEFAERLSDFTEPSRRRRQAVAGPERFRD
jgi:hypothetical protein